MNCWHREIDKAASEAEIVINTRDFLVLWSPQELCTLTHEDKVPTISTGADIVRLQHRLAESRRDLMPHSEHIEALVAYIGHAATRIRELRGTA